MINPTESLAFSMHANPGVYAVLVGSGLSAGSQDSHGLGYYAGLGAEARGTPQRRPASPIRKRWYQNVFSKEADYSDLLEALCPTAAERQQLLRGYFEPERERP